VWQDDDFRLVDPRKVTSEDNVTLKIDENTRKIVVHLPFGVNVITRRTVERRLRSIERSGYILESGPTVGRGFEVEMSGETEPPPVPASLLDVRHSGGQGYRAHAEPTTAPAPVPTPEPAPTQAHVPAEREISPYHYVGEETVAAKAPIADATEEENRILGIIVRHLLSLGEMSDIYLSRKGKVFTVGFRGNFAEFAIEQGQLVEVSSPPGSSREIMAAFQAARAD